MGWPVGQSRSPLIHNYWIAKYGLEGDYIRLPVKPDAPTGLKDAIAGMRAMHQCITVPWLPLANDLSRITLAAIGMAVILWLAGPEIEIVARVMLGGAIYAGLFMLVGGATILRLRSRINE